MTKVSYIVRSHWSDGSVTEQVRSNKRVAEWLVETLRNVGNVTRVELIHSRRADSHEERVVIWIAICAIVSAVTCVLAVMAGLNRADRVGYDDAGLGLSRAEAESIRRRL